MRRLARHSVVPRRGHSKQCSSSLTASSPQQRSLYSEQVLRNGQLSLARPPRPLCTYILHCYLLVFPPNNQELGVRRSIWGPTLGVGSHGTSHAAFAHNRVRTAWRSLRSPTGSQVPRT